MSFCPSCGKAVDADTTFCPNCGYDVRSGGQGFSVPGGAPTISMPMTRQRPAGVTILAILEMLGGALMFLAGILIFSVMGVAASTFTDGLRFLASFMGGVLGGVLLVIGLIGIGLGYGLWKGNGWAWILTLVFSALGILASLWGLPPSIVIILIEIAILYYLTRPHVKLYFGK